MESIYSDSKNNPVVEQMKIKIDARERKRIKQARSYFENKEHQVTVSQMQYGDFVCDNVCIEYKTTRDFIQSVQTGRVFRQAINMRNNYKYPIVMIEAEHDKMDKEIRSSQFYGIPFSWKQFYGAYASLCATCNVVIVKNFTEALKFMDRIFEKCNDNKLRVFVKPETPSEQWIVNFLCSQKGNGIGVKTAERIVDTLGLETLEDLLNVTSEDLLSVKGVGQNHTKKIMKMIR